MSVWLENLNTEQNRAVQHGSVPLLILAGAGSGKTRAITSRIAWLVEHKNFNPASILAVTFTNKAANEMRERALNMSARTEKTIIRTFHSFGAWLLRRNAEAAGLEPSFTIYDDDDQVALLAQIFPGQPRRILRTYAQRIARCKDNNIASSDDSVNYHLREIYDAYEQRLREIGNVDFGDLILRPLQLLQHRLDIRQRLHQRFRAILVDEYQDTNTAQAQLLQELCAKDAWLCVVGDDDQSIYSFRGARIGNILNFPDMFPGAQIIKLEQNYRSTGYILQAASQVVGNNSSRHKKQLWTDKPSGEKPMCVFLEDSEEEAQWCVKQLANPADWAKTAILYRTNAQSLAFENALRYSDIPYRLVGSLSFYQREEVKDVLAFLAFLANPRDEISFRRIANKPARGLGPARVKALVNSARQENQGSIALALEKANFKDKAARARQLFLTLFERYSGNTEFETLGLLIADMVHLTGLHDYYTNMDNAEHTQKMSNINELVTLASDYNANTSGLCTFLEIIELDRSIIENQNDADEAHENKVTLITVHNTKGLEFERVIITGVEENLFPHTNAETEEDIEEERRLFYVAITRAKYNLAFTSCKCRMLWGKPRFNMPSRFLQEISTEYLNVVGKESQQEEQMDWIPGMRVYHDDYGLGIIQKRIVRAGHVSVRIHFESGRSAIIMPEFSQHNIEILGMGDL